MAARRLRQPRSGPGPGSAAAKAVDRPGYRLLLPLALSPLPPMRPSNGRPPAARPHTHPLRCLRSAAATSPPAAQDNGNRNSGSFLSRKQEMASRAPSLPPGCFRKFLERRTGRRLPDRRAHARVGRPLLPVGGAAARGAPWGGVAASTLRNRAR